MTWADGPILGFDLETTSVDPMTALPVSFALAYFTGDEITHVRHGLVNPEVPIPAEATEIHGITDTMVAERGGSLENTITGIVGELILAESLATPVVVMNASYDLTVIDQLWKTFNDGEGLYESGWHGHVVDPLVIDRKVDKWRKGSRKLHALCEHYGVRQRNAHSAADDAVAAVWVAKAIAAEHPSIGNIDLYLLHAQQHAWHREWAKDFSRYRVERGDDPLAEEEGDWPLRGDSDMPELQAAAPIAQA